MSLIPSPRNSFSMQLVGPAPPRTGRKTLTPHAGTTTPVSDPPHRIDTGVVVVGAGLAGLAAATRLQSEKIPFLLIEASDGVGGRVRTDVVDGFLLDRGFQIFITAYPEARKLLDYSALELREFYSGALVYFNGQFHRVSDPTRHLPDAILSLANPIGSIPDKLLIGYNRIGVVTRSDQEILSAQETSILNRLHQTGFSDSIIDRFFRPFFGGIFFDRELETTSRLFDFIFKCLALGNNTLPANGIGSIPNHLAEKLPSSSIWLNSRVGSVQFRNGSDPTQVRLENGKLVRGELGVIVAVDEPEADKLLHGKIERKPDGKPVRSTTCLYFSADWSPVQEPVLLLNGTGTGIVNNMFFATEVAKSYGPPGKTLVSVSVIGSCNGIPDEELTRNVIGELSGWFGRSVVESWRHLRTYRIGFAQPNQSPPTHFVGNKPSLGGGVYVCGDYRNSATFDGALVSGTRAAEALLEDRKALLRDRGLSFSVA